MPKKIINPLQWVRLDNAAKIYPPTRSKNWSSVYRQSITLHDEVDVTTLKSALDVCVKRFPSICARLRKGAFWYYLQQVEKAPEIREEYSYPLEHMTKEEMRKCAFRVIVYKNRIAVEYFHSLTDGTGALIFIKNLVAEYIEQKYNVKIPLENGILDRKQPPIQEEMEDCFPKNAGPVPAVRKDTDAWHMGGEPEKDGFMNWTCFTLPVKDVLEVAHKYSATLTVFISAIIMKALLNLQNERNPHVRSQKRLKLMIPINLRNLFPSNTLRNFSMYTIPEIDPRLGEYSFQEICDVIKHKMGSDFTAKQMSKVIKTNVNDEQNPFIRLIPLPIKNAVMKAIFYMAGERKYCLSLSNLGKVTVPKEMDKFIKRFDFVLGIQAGSPCSCGMLSFHDTLYINFIRNTIIPELEPHFFAVLQELGLSATVESNQKEK